MHALLDKKFKHTLAHSNVQNFKGTFYLLDYGMHVRVNLYRFSLSTTIIVSCFLTSITFKSYSYFDSSNIHTHAAIHITFHFLSPCCQCYPLVVQSLIFGVSSSHFFLLHAITINFLRMNFCVDRGVHQLHDRMKMATEKLTCHAVSLN